MCDLFARVSSLVYKLVKYICVTSLQYNHSLNSEARGKAFKAEVITRKYKTPFFLSETK